MRQSRASSDLSQLVSQRSALLAAGAVASSLALGAAITVLPITPVEIALIIGAMLVMMVWAIMLFVSNRSAKIALQLLIFMCPVLYAIMVPDVYVPGGRRGALSLYTAVIQFMLGVAILGFILLPQNRLFRSSGSHRQILKFAVSCLIALVLLGLSVGFIHENSFDYLLGDVVKPLAFISLFILLMGLARTDLQKVYLVLYAGLFISQAITFVNWLVVQPPRLGSTSWHNNLALFTGAVAVAVFTTRMKLFLLGCLGVFLSIFIGSQMAYRTLLLLYPFALFLIGTLVVAAKDRSIRSRLLRRLFIVALLVAALGVVASMANFELMEVVIRRFSGLNSRTGDASLQGRISEAESVFIYLRNGGPLSWMLGYGFGAQYDLPSFYTSDTGSKAIEIYSSSGYQVHNVHIYYLAVLFRAGAIGLALWTVFHATIVYCLGRSLKQSLTGTDSFEMFLFTWAFTYVIAVSVAATMFSMLDRDLNFALLGLASLLYSKKAYGGEVQINAGERRHVLSVIKPSFTLPAEKPLIHSRLRNARGRS